MLKFLIKLLVSTSIIAYLLSRTEITTVIDRMKSADTLLVFASGSILFLLVLPQSFRWLSILRIAGARIGFMAATGITMVGWFFNQVLPSSVGGDAFRAWYAYRFGARLATATQSVIFDRVSALIAIMFILLASSPFLTTFFTSNEPVYSVMGFAVMLLFAAVGLLIADKVFASLLPESIRKHVVEFSVTARKVFLGRTGFRVVVLSVLIHCSIALAVWLLARSMNVPLELVHALLLMPVILFFTAIPISIAGWGIRESAMVVIFGMVGVPDESAIAISLGFGLLMLVTSLPGGVVWWFLHHEVPQSE